MKFAELIQLGPEQAMVTAMTIGKYKWKTVFSLRLLTE
jgi:hypothetical protein